MYQANAKVIIVVTVIILHLTRKLNAKKRI